MSGFVFEPGDALSGTVTYSYDDYAFNFRPEYREEVDRRSGGGRRFSFALGTLQLEVGLVTGVVLYAWGYLPYQHWKPAVMAPTLQPGTVRVNEFKDVGYGAAVQLTEADDWVTSFDRRSGWVRIHRDTSEYREQAILIADETALGLDEGRIASVWLHPIFVS